MSPSKMSNTSLKFVTNQNVKPNSKIFYHTKMSQMGEHGWPNLKFFLITKFCSTKPKYFCTTNNKICSTKSKNLAQTWYMKPKSFAQPTIFVQPKTPHKFCSTNFKILFNQKLYTNFIQPTQFLTSPGHCQQCHPSNMTPWHPSWHHDKGVKSSKCQHDTILTIQLKYNNDSWNKP